MNKTDAKKIARMVSLIIELNPSIAEDVYAYAVRRDMESKTGFTFEKGSEPDPTSKTSEPEYVPFDSEKYLAAGRTIEGAVYTDKNGVEHVKKSYRRRVYEAAGMKVPAKYLK